MKKILTFTLLFGLGLLSTSCDEGFDEMNTNRTAATTLNPVFLLNNAVINASFPGGILVYDMGIVQQIVTPNSGVLAGANFNQDNRNVTQEIWQRYYRSVIRNTADIIRVTSSDPSRSNLYHMARIFQAYGFMVLTDSYGDIPYFQAGKGFSEQAVLPVYDGQEAIYTDIIKELTEASAALDASKTVETADVLYSGNVDKWKKFGFSLLLRAGMRLSAANPTLAQQTVQRAVQGGVMQANNDNAVVQHNANYTNALGGTLNATEANNYYLAAPFVNYLKMNNDPRLKSIATRYVGAASGPQQVPARASIDPAVQIGMPLGFDNSGIVARAQADGLASFYDYSQLDRTRLAKQQSPMFLVTYAQTSLHVAEAVQRGWVQGSAATFFTNGVRAHMEQMALYDAASAIPEADIAAYLAAHPYDSSNGLQQINTQYWVASLMNGPEAFANFRRSNFPVLTPNPFPGKGISTDFINRLTYPNSEISVNSTNVQAAISRMGADELDTKVWWDK
ncbi:SusD/RagB family nutrient-binding outer membrane lipoprotein [Arundinibacter roseus]|uniref:SusD/RagB family nutrient-binding outer membrane lipoprotein n=1 Tax=Arundinibacter roseus TaxID=2070510 RepID=A0A4R4K5B1_9BACT|nr:SusD/RagB family nutrient-binding outer membrane lipoprotein [Arundinibacter roseus]TDB61862.1 SusD/RagB family nutrient-binding outer membrane lipoprotein [Arundinibacter roseus]